MRKKVLIKLAEFKKYLKQNEHRLGLVLAKNNALLEDDDVFI